MTSETNRTEYKRHLADDLEREVIAFKKYPASHPASEITDQSIV